MTEPTAQEQPDDGTAAWLADFYAALDGAGSDPGALAAHLDPDVVAHFGNLPSFAGRDALLPAVAERARAIGSRHHVREHWRRGDRVAVRLDVEYLPAGRAAVTLPVAVVLGLRDGRVAEWRVYADQTPLAG